MATLVMKDLSISSAEDFDVSDFQMLEEKIRRTAEILRSEREGRQKAEAENRGLLEKLEGSHLKIKTLEANLTELRGDRNEVKTRIERMLHQLDELTAQ